MDRALRNWERLVKSLEQPSLAPSDSHAFHVPSSLAARDQIASRESDITKILEVADEIEARNSDVALILYEHAFAKSQSLDPNSKGRGVLQFKTGLMSFIKQKRAKERGTAVHPKGDEQYRMNMSTLQKFYESYRQEHLDLIQEDSLATGDTKKSEERKLNRQKVLTTLRVLKDALETYEKKYPKEAERVLTSQFKSLMKSDARYLEALIPYNILPLEGPDESDLSALPELKAARKVLEVPDLHIGDDFQRPRHRQQDVFDALEVAFGFQPDNIKNQREHLVLLLANAQSRCIDPSKLKAEDIGDTVNSLCRRILDNYEKWCLYIREPCVLDRVKENHEKVPLMALYLCIWGEAANVRFLPECICYIYHHMAGELLAMFNGGHIEPSQSFKSERDVKQKLRFLEDVIIPIYKSLAVEAKKSNGGKAPHSRWRNYDDFNEFFWSRSCFYKLKWPFKGHLGSSFFSNEKGHGKSSGKTSFVEHRTFLHLYHSFVRVWILLVMMLQALGIIAFNTNFDFNTVKILLSLGPTYFVMKFIESVLDIVLMVGAYFSSRRSAIIRIFVHFLWYGGCTVGLVYLYINTWQDPSGFFLKVYVWVLGSYAAVKLFLSLIQHSPSVREQVRKTSEFRIVETLKWLYQERFYVGRGLSETLRYYIRYVLFWMLLLACKFTSTYYFQIRPLVIPTRVIVANTAKVEYAWLDIISGGNHNALSVFFLWAPIVLIYLLDVSIWYTLVSSILGLIIGTKDRLGEIRTLDMLRIRFESFPKSFIKNLQHDKPANQNEMKGDEDLQAQENAHIFAPFWNKIVACLREEDYITNIEKHHLIMPSVKSNMNIVQWPLFLLASKVSLALNLVVEKRESPEDVVERLGNDHYMRVAVEEAVESLHNLLDSLLVGKGKTFFNKVYGYLKESLADRNVHEFFADFRMDGISDIYWSTTALVTKLLKAVPSSHGRDVSNINVDAEVQKLYNSVLQFLSEDLKREEYSDYSTIKAEYIFHDVKLPPLKEEQLRRLKLLLLSKESAATIPKNREARRRLEFFTNSLFMRMPGAPSVRAMKSFSVLTPYFNEIVMFSKDDLQRENEDGITTLFYLQKIFPDEWHNFLERVALTEQTLMQMLKKDNAEFREQEHQLELELRLWASYRGQTLARTVRGMMYYRTALMLQASLEALETGKGFEETKKPGIKQALADIKFTYVVSCQIYGQQKAGPDKNGLIKAKDIQQLLKMNESLRVAYVDIVDSTEVNGGKDYYSKLIKSDDAGKDQVIYSIKLPGNPILGEGKPENQNHAVIFTRGDGLQTIDMNQDNYFEEALKIRNLLEEFEGEHGRHAPTILGVREHVFTGSVSSLAWFMSNQERSFVTLGQRVLARPLKVRMHYGHPDVFDRLFHVTRGGISKASKTINVSEDIYAGFNSTLRQGQVTHHEYIQVGKGRDVGLNQIALFEAKVSSGNGEQLLSRDVYRLGQLFDFFRMLSFYYTTVGYYVCTMMTTLVVFVFLYGKAYLALSGVGRYFLSLALATQNTALMAALNTQFVYQMGFFNAVPMLMVFILEEGFLKAIVSFITMQLQLSPIFFTFSLGTRTHYFGRTVLHGGAKYRETGRGFVVQHIKFAENYRLYSQSHFVKALEIMMLLLVILAYGYDSSTTSYIVFSIFCWFLAFSWLFAPYIFNPSGFEWQKTVEDFEDWTNWLLYRGGVGVKGSDSWEAWWDEGQEHIRTTIGRVSETILSLRFLVFQYGVVYHLHVVNGDTKPSVYGFSWLVLVGLILIFLVFSYSPRSSVNYQMFLRFVQGMVFIMVLVGLVVVVALTPVTLGDMFASLLAFVPTGWAVLSIGIAWKPVVKRMGLWRSVRAIAWYYDAVMGAIIFFPIAILSWFPFVSTFQTRLLFNQAFSRGLEISLILSGNKPNTQS